MKDISCFKEKNIHVVGISGAEGSAVVNFLYSQGIKNLVGHDHCQKKDFRKSFYTFHDWLSGRQKKEEFEKLESLSIELNFQDKYLEGIKKADIIFVPQSWFRYQFNRPLRRYYKRKEFKSITQLYFDLAPCPIVTVTGTAGKSTTTKLISELVTSHGVRVFHTGNDRKTGQILDQILDIPTDALLVMEVSNRQLLFDWKRPARVAVLTNISPNHLDDHGNFEAYIGTKRKIFNHQTLNDFAVLNWDDEVVRNIAQDLESKVSYFSTKCRVADGAYLDNERIVVCREGREYQICSIKDLKLKGKHNFENVLAACAVADLAGVPAKVMREVLPKFNGLPHRMELVAEIDGVEYYNDTASSRPSSLRAALGSFGMAPVTLIAGGTRKNVYEGEFEEMARAILASRVKNLCLIGEKAGEIEKGVRRLLALEGVKPIQMKQFNDLDAAVNFSAQKTKSGGVVLFSPGCESFDMFKDYRDRGEKFKSAVKKLKEK